MIGMRIHGIKAIEVRSTFPENGNGVTIQIHTHEGTTTIDFYGNTEALLSLPKSPKFVRYNEPTGAR